MKQPQPHDSAFPFTAFLWQTGKTVEQGFDKVKNLGRGRGEAWRGEGNPSLERFPSPLQFPTTIYFPNVTRMSLSTNTSACMFLADGLRRGGGKLREDFVGIAL